MEFVMGYNDEELKLVFIDIQAWAVLLPAPQDNYLKIKILKYTTVFAYLHILDTMGTNFLSLIHQWGNTGQLNLFLQIVFKVACINS